MVCCPHIFLDVNLFQDATLLTEDRRFGFSDFHGVYCVNTQTPQLVHPILHHMYSWMPMQLTMSSMCITRVFLQNLPHPLPEL